MANYPYELAQDAAYQSYTSRLTELWSLPKPAQGLNTYNNNKTWVFRCLWRSQERGFYVDENLSLDVLKHS